MAAQIIISARTGDPSACSYNGTVKASHRTERYHYNLQHFISGLIRVSSLILIPKKNEAINQFGWMSHLCHDVPRVFFADDRSWRRFGGCPAAMKGKGC
jgi:hypothetical protein